MKTAKKTIKTEEEPASRLYYKVCWRTPSDVLTSCSIGALRDYESSTTGYQPFVYDTIYFEPKDGRWSRPSVPGTKLFVFGELYKARNFSNYGMAKLHMKYRAEIWTCEATGVVEEPGQILFGVGDSYNLETFAEFWTGKLDNPYSIATPPESTIWCDQLKLIERVL